MEGTDETIFNDAINGELGPLVEMLRLECPSGKLVAADPMVNPDRTAILTTFPPGTYPVLGISHPEDERLAIVILKLTDGTPVRWEFETSYGVDAGLGCYMDVDAQTLFLETEAELAKSPNFASYYDDVIDAELYGDGADGPILYCDHKPDKKNTLNVAIFESGWGDGVYDVYSGRDADGNVVCFLTDFQLFDTFDDEDA